MLTVALTLFNLGNGGMLSLLGQKLVATAADATTWTARYVMVAQLVMVPVALFAGSLADKRGRRQILMVAFAVLPVRAVLSGLIDDPVWLISAEMLDGVASGHRRGGGAGGGGRPDLGVRPHPDGARQRQRGAGRRRRPVGLVRRPGATACSAGPARSSPSACRR